MNALAVFFRENSRLVFIFLGGFLGAFLGLSYCLVVPGGLGQKYSKVYETDLDPSACALFPIDCSVYITNVLYYSKNTGNLKFYEREYDGRTRFFLGLSGSKVVGDEVSLLATVNAALEDFNSKIDENFSREVEIKKVKIFQILTELMAKVKKTAPDIADYFKVENLWEKTDDSINATMAVLLNHNVMTEKEVEDLLNRILSMKLDIAMKQDQYKKWSDNIGIRWPTPLVVVPVFKELRDVSKSLAQPTNDRAIKRSLFFVLIGGFMGIMFSIFIISFWGSIKLVGNEAKRG